MMTIILQYQFLETFKGPRKDNYGNEGPFKKLTDKEWNQKFEEWANLQYMQYAISGAQAYSLILRLLFNAKIDREKLNPIEIDLYIQLDLILSVVGGASHFFIVMLGPEFIRND